MTFRRLVGTQNTTGFVFPNMYHNFPNHGDEDKEIQLWSRNDNTEFLSMGEGSNGPPDVATPQLLAAPDRRVRKDAGISYCYCC